MASPIEVLLQQQQNSRTNYQPLIQANPAAAQTLAQGAVNAGNIGSARLNQGLNALNTGAASSVNVRQPYMQGATSSLQNALDLTGVSGKSSDQVLQQMQNSPGYQFNLQEQLNAIDRGAASKGKLYSGQTLKAYQDRAANVASNEYQNQINNSLALLQQTSPFASQQAQQDYTLGTDQAAIQSQIGDVLGNAELARSNALAEGLLGEASARVAQSSTGGTAGLPEMDQEVYAGGSTSPWGNSVGGGGGAAGGAGLEGSTAQPGGSESPWGSSVGGDSGSALGDALAGAGSGAAAEEGGAGTFTDSSGTTYTYNPETKQWDQSATQGQPGTGGQAGAGGGLVTGGSITGEDFNNPGYGGPGENAGNPAAGIGDSLTPTASDDSNLGMLQSSLPTLMNEISSGDPVRQSAATLQAMGAYNSAYDDFQQLYNEYKANPAMVGDAAITDMSAQLNQMQQQLADAGLWNPGAWIEQQGGAGGGQSQAPEAAMPGLTQSSLSGL